MKKIKLLLLVLLVGIQAVAAQTVQVTGKVTYADDGTPVVGATVNIKGTTNGTATDINGDFKITAPANSSKVLVIRALGLTEQEISVPTSGVYNVSMKTAAVSADDVIVTGYGSPRRAGTAVGSSVKVNAKSIEARASSSAMESLQGQVPGLAVYTSSGDPGTVQSVRLHGVGSLTAGNTPLYIVDGTPVDSRTVVAMNPNDFESVTVLKDASATSIYGSRAANGVIYIATKRGSFDSKAKITARAQYGISSLANKDYYNQMMNTESLFNFWKETGIRSQAQIQSQIANLKKNNITDENGNLWDTKWIDYMQKDNRPMIQADLAVQGGGKNVSYYVSGGYNKEDGTAPGSFYERGTVRSNIDAKVNDWFKTGVNLQLSLDKRATNSQYGTNSLAGGLSYLNQPFYSPYDNKGGTPDMMPGMGSRANPYYYVDKNPDTYTRYGITGNVFVELEPVKNLKIRSVVGADKSITLRDAKTYPTYIPANGSGSVTKGEYENLSATITNTIEYSMNFNDKHRVSLLAGQEGVAYRYSQFVAQSKGQNDDRMMQLGNGLQDTYSVSSRDNSSNFLSFFGRAEYSFDNRFFFDATVRNDASSRFGKNNRSATFWSVGGMWNLKNESWLKDSKVVSALNLKASYGTQGNSSIPDIYTYGDGDYLHTSNVSSITDYRQAAAWAIATPGNPDLAWETQKKLTIGASVTLWEKLTVGVEYYDRTTDNMLMNVPIPGTTGFNEVLKNVGSMNNQGVDININYDILRGKDYSLSVYANFNYNKDKITKLFDGRQRWVVPNTGMAYVVGESAMFYYPIYAGVNSETGRMQWYKPGENVDKTTTDNGVTSTFNEDVLTQNTGKKLYAPMVGGFGLNGSWKGISIQADFTFALNKTLMSNDRYFSENPWGFAGYNTSANVLDYWKKPGDVTMYPNWKQNQVMQFDTHLLEDASFLRLKNLTVAYTLPSKILRNSKSLTGFKVFFTARNLFTVTNFKGIDPEVDANTSLGRVGNSKTFSFGIELYF